MLDFKGLLNTAEDGFVDSYIMYKFSDVYMTTGMEYNEYIRDIYKEIEGLLEIGETPEYKTNTVKDEEGNLIPNINLSSFTAGCVLLKNSLKARVVVLKALQEYSARIDNLRESLEDIADGNPQDAAEKARKALELDEKREEALNAYRTFKLKINETPFKLFKGIRGEYVMATAVAAISYQVVKKSPSAYRQEKGETFLRCIDSAKSVEELNLFLTSINLISDSLKKGRRLLDIFNEVKLKALSK